MSKSESSVAHCHYRVKSVNTKWYAITDNEVNGSVVTTADGASSVPAHSVLTIAPCLDEAVKVVTITGPKGLYVALPNNAGEEASLIWSSTHYEWVIRLTGDGNYEITPADGKDLYWYDKFGIGRVFKVKAGRNVVAPEHYYTISRA